MVTVNLKCKCSKCGEFHPFPEDTEGKFVCQKCQEILYKIKKMEEREEFKFAEPMKEILFYMIQDNIEQIDFLIEKERKKA